MRGRQLVGGFVFPSLFELAACSRQLFLDQELEISLCRQLQNSGSGPMLDLESLLDTDCRFSAFSVILIAPL